MKIVTAMAVAGLVLLCAAAVGATTCDGELDNRVFDCQFVSQDGERFTGCLQFGSPGAIGEIDLHADIQTSITTSQLAGACSCGPTGSLRNPKFDTSKSFDCLATSTLGFPLIIAGKVGGPRITGGHTTASGGFSSIFACTRRREPGTCP
jgi:hypothetical protein